ncbi:MAG: hypothetical protein KDK25_13500 [Leptospiraceae bacterium]|nr:hypothetical protein [Leptospiraceae bacterium]
MLQTIFLEPSMHPVQLIQETEDFAAFYKPAGLVFFEDSQQTDFLDEMRALCSDQANRLFPVHRLDKVTSGVLLCAKGRKNANLLGNEFRFNRAEKVYVALSARPGFKKAGMIVGDMEKSRRGSYKLLRSRDNPARTSFISQSLQDQRPGLRLMWVRPITGKTHQIRVALKSVGFAILGDPLYNAFSDARQEDRTYLHALALKFELNGKQFTLHQLPLEGEEFLNPLCLESIKEIRDPYSLDYPGLNRRARKGTGSGKDSPEKTGPASSGNRKGRGSSIPGRKVPASRGSAEKSMPPSKQGSGQADRSSTKSGPSPEKAGRKKGKRKPRKGNPPGHRHSGNL